MKKLKIFISIILLFAVFTHLKAEEKDHFLKFECENSFLNFNLIKKARQPSRAKFARMSEDEIGFKTLYNKKSEAWLLAGKFENKPFITMYFFSWETYKLEAYSYYLTEEEYAIILKRSKLDASRMTLVDLKWKIYRDKMNQKAKVLDYTKTKCKFIK